MEKRNKFIYWTPRILSILFIVFLSLFSLDVFDIPSLSFWQIIVGLFMHNIPSIILIIILIIAWKSEIVGAIAFILAGLLYISQIIISGITSNNFEWYMLSYSLIIALPALLIGILFLIGWIKKKKN
ncbi:MAG: hypothetical protein V1824_04375 [archaeon]